MAKKNNPIESFIVFDTDGRVNVDASVEAAAEAVAEYSTETEATQTLVMGCLNQLFDDHMGQRIAQASIVGAVIQSIGKAVPELDDVLRYPALTKMVNGVLQAQIRSGYLNVTKGPVGCGTGRTSDCPVKESASAIKAAAKAAKLAASTK